MKIICFYHCPCLDGAFSVLTLFAFVKCVIEGKKIKGEFNEFFQRLLDYPKKKGDNKEIIEEIKEEIQGNMEIEEEKGDSKEFLLSFFDKTEKFKDVIQFFGVKPSRDNENFRSLLKRIKYHLNPEETIIILLDYYGESLANLELLSSLSKKLIIIDHHQSFFELFNTVEFNIKEKITIFGNIENGACVLTYKFLSELLGDILPFNLSSRLLNILQYIEDHDLRSRKFKETEAIITSLLELINDLSIYSNPMLFNSLMKHEIPILIELGTPILARKLEKIKVLLKNKRKIKIIISPTVKIQGFSLKITNGQDKSLINELGEALAEESMKEEMDNIGIVFLQLNEGFRVCMRGLNTKAESPCLLIAKSIDGGGHKFAAGGWISKKTMKKWFQN